MFCDVIIKVSHDARGFKEGVAKLKWRLTRARKDMNKMAFSVAIAVALPLPFTVLVQYVPLIVDYSKFNINSFNLELLIIFY